MFFHPDEDSQIATTASVFAIHALFIGLILHQILSVGGRRVGGSIGSSTGFSSSRPRRGAFRDCADLGRIRRCPGGGRRFSVGRVLGERFVGQSRRGSWQGAMVLGVEVVRLFIEIPRLQPFYMCQVHTGRVVVLQGTGGGTC